MEIKANYVLIGAFTILGILGLLGVFVWLASVQIDRQFRLYDIYFDSVSGLGRAADVRYNGLTVGQVLSLDLEPDDPRIRVRIEVAAETPVREGTTAQLATQGVTGVSYVSLSGGEAGGPALHEVSDEAIPVIPSEPSLVQTLTEQAPDLLTEAANLLAELQVFAGPANQARVGTLLENLSRSSGALDQALQDFSQISRTVATATDQITEFTGRLDAIGGAVQTTLAALDETLATARDTIAEAERTLVAATDALDTTESTVGVVGATIQNEVPALADDLSAAINSVEVAVAEATEELASVTARFRGTADLADARLVDLGEALALAELTLTDARQSFDSVDAASEAVETLVEGTGASLVDDARATLATVDETLAGLNSAVVDELPGIAEDVRAATASASRVIAQTEQAVSTLPERFAPLAETAETTLATATGTLRRAEQTLAQLDGAIAAAETTFAAAEDAFTGASGIVDEVGPAAADLRSAARSVETTMAALTEDLPGIAADLSETAARARTVAETIETAVGNAAPGVESFAARGLPEFTRFAREAQGLVASLERLISRIERDPTRFFFGNSTPEFGR